MNHLCDKRMNDQVTEGEETEDDTGLDGPNKCSKCDLTIEQRQTILA